MGVEQGGEFQSPEEAQAAAEFNAKGAEAKTGETETISQDDVIKDALKMAAETPSDSILRNPEQLAADFESTIDQWTAEVNKSQEVLARPDLPESARKDWEKQLASDQKQLGYLQGRYEEFKQRRGLS